MNTAARNNITCSKLMTNSSVINCQRNATPIKHREIFMWCEFFFSDKLETRIRMIPSSLGDVRLAVGKGFDKKSLNWKGFLLELNEVASSLDYNGISGTSGKPFVTPGNCYSRIFFCFDKAWVKRVSRLREITLRSFVKHTRIFLYPLKVNSNPASMKLYFLQYFEALSVIFRFF